VFSLENFYEHEYWLFNLEIVSNVYIQF